MTECCRKKNVGKPCEGEPHAWFDEGRMKISSAYSTLKGSDEYEQEVPGSRFHKFDSTADL